jgi:hypothetical protein
MPTRHGHDSNLCMGETQHQLPRSFRRLPGLIPVVLTAGVFKPAALRLFYQGTMLQYSGTHFLLRVYWQRLSISCPRFRPFAGPSPRGSDVNVRPISTREESAHDTPGSIRVRSPHPGSDCRRAVRGERDTGSKRRTCTVVGLPVCRPAGFPDAAARPFLRPPGNLPRSA